MATIKIAVLNEYNGLTDADIIPVVEALSIQVKQHFAPIWGIDADLTYYPAGNQPPLDAWQLVIFDTSDQAGALGYHDLTNMGLPMGKIFAGTDKKYNSSWTVTASHELLEMLGDPDVNLCAVAEGQDQTTLLYAYEVCDACESDQFGYTIHAGGQDILVSDFVDPAWFETIVYPNAQFDYQRKITAPFQLLPGGYIPVMDISGNDGWVQKTARNTSRRFQMRANVGTRRERRRTPRSQWLRSAVRPGSPNAGLRTVGLMAQVSQMEFSGAATLTADFLLGQGHIDATLFRDGAAIAQGSNTNGGTIVFGDVRTFDSLAVNGICTNGIDITISTATNPGTPLHHTDTAIFDNFVFL